MEGGKPENLEKNSQSRGENHPQTQLTYVPSSGIEPGTVAVRSNALTVDATPASLLYQKLEKIARISNSSICCLSKK
jgi:hypothetical protein